MSGAHAASPYGPGGMRLFFYKLCFLIRYPATWIFVFDGQLKVQIKRDTHVIPKNPQWAGPCKRLLEIFGFMIHEVSVMIRVLSCWPLITGLMHQAPGEAEAELAKLNAVGLVDAVFTSDSDALVFGARCVIRRLVIRRSVALINLMIH